MATKRYLNIPLARLELLQAMDNVTAGLLFKHLHAHALHLPPPAETNQLAEFFCNTITAEMDVMEQQRQKVSAAMSLNGKKGGRPAGSKKNPATASTPAPQATTCEPEPEASTPHAAFLLWLQAEHPFILERFTASRRHLVTETEYNRLLKTYTAALIQQAVSDLDNNEKCRSQYTNLYNTLQKWLPTTKIPISPTSSACPVRSDIAAAASKDSMPAKTSEEEARRTFIAMLRKDAARGDQRAIDELKKYEK